MMQVDKLTSQLPFLLESSKDFYQNLLGYKPEKTTLKIVPKMQWNPFIRVHISLKSSSAGGSY